jgi:hypothetical protein
MTVNIQNIPSRIEELQAQLKAGETELRSLKGELKTALEQSGGTELRLTDSEGERWRVGYSHPQFLYRGLSPEEVRREVGSDLFDRAFRVEVLLVGSTVGELTEEERETLRAASTDIRQGVWARRDNF